MALVIYFIDLVSKYCTFFLVLYKVGCKLPKTPV